MAAERYRVTVERLVGNDSVDAERVFEQVVDGDKFNIRSVITAINTPPRGPRTRKTKAGEVLVNVPTSGSAQNP